MSASDYLFPLLLILSVIRQARGKHLTWFQLAWPVGLVILAAVKYLHGMPTTANNLTLVVATALTGSRAYPHPRRAGDACRSRHPRGVASGSGISVSAERSGT